MLIIIAAVVAAMLNFGIVYGLIKNEDRGDE